VLNLSDEKPQGFNNLQQDQPYLGGPANTFLADSVPPRKDCGWREATMKKLKMYGVIFVILSLSLVCGFSSAEAVNTMSNYISTPPFLSGGGVTPNLLLLIDNSASMYELAYVGDAGYCYDDTYDSASTYVGSFAPGSWYGYNLVAENFELKTAAEAATICGSATYTNTDVCITSNATSVTTFAAKGNFLNWAAASKLDIEKEILTGGKYDSTNNRLVMESRGCVDRRFVKKVPLTDSGSNTYYVTLAARPAAASEKASASDNTTRIEIFEVTATGFDNTACQSAIDELAAPSPNQGQIKQDIEDCMGYTNKDKQLADAMNAFNHSIHNCWYKQKHGDWPPGAGPTVSIKTTAKRYTKIFFLLTLGLSIGVM
jgi:type IV pilus assembly protein PilY1